MCVRPGDRRARADRPCCAREAAVTAGAVPRARGASRRAQSSGIAQDPTHAHAASRQNSRDAPPHRARRRGCRRVHPGSDQLHPGRARTSAAAVSVPRESRRTTKREEFVVCERRVARRRVRCVRAHAGPPRLARRHPSPPPSRASATRCVRLRAPRWPQEERLRRPLPRHPLSTPPPRPRPSPTRLTARPTWSSPPAARTSLVPASSPPRRRPHQGRPPRSPVSRPRAAQACCSSTWRRQRRRHLHLQRPSLQASGHAHACFSAIRVVVPHAPTPRHTVPCRCPQCLWCRRPLNPPSWPPQPRRRPRRQPAPSRPPRSARAASASSRPTPSPSPTPSRQVRGSRERALCVHLNHLTLVPPHALSTLCCAPDPAERQPHGRQVPAQRAGTPGRRDLAPGGPVWGWQAVTLPLIVSTLLDACDCPHRTNEAHSFASRAAEAGCGHQERMGRSSGPQPHVPQRGKKKLASKRPHDESAQLSLLEPACSRCLALTRNNTLHPPVPPTFCTPLLLHHRSYSQRWNSSVTGMWPGCEPMAALTVFIVCTHRSSAASHTWANRHNSRTLGPCTACPVDHQRRTSPATTSRTICCPPRTAAPP